MSEERLRRALAKLPGLYDECLHAMAPPSRQKLRERVSGSRDTTVVNEDAHQLRRDITALLRYWIQVVDGTVPPDVPGRVATLQAHAAEIAARNDAERLLASLESLLASAVTGSPEPRVLAGRCVEPGCPGRIVAERSDTTTLVRCAATGRTWPVDQWLRLRTTMRGALR